MDSGVFAAPAIDVWIRDIEELAFQTEMAPRTAADFVAAMVFLGADMDRGPHLLRKFHQNVALLRGGAGPLHDFLTYADPETLEKLKKTIRTSQALDVVAPVLVAEPGAVHIAAFEAAAFGRGGPGFAKKSLERMVQ